MREKLVGQFDKERGKFMDTPDTNFQPSLDVMLPETKKFPYANKVSDFGLNDMISDKKFRFGNVDNHMLLGEQLPEERSFKFSSGIKGINDHFDSMAPNKDYRYTDPQFYEYKLKGMTQQKIAETNWRVQGDDSITNPDDLDGYARAVAYAEEYRKSRQARTSVPMERSDSAPMERSDSGVSGNPNTKLINALVPYESKPTSSKNSPNNSKAPSRRNSDSGLDLTGSKVVDQMEQLEKGGISIEPAKMKKRDPILVNQTLNKLHNVHQNHSMKSSFARWKTHTNEQRERNTMSAEEKKSPGKIQAPKETASAPKQAPKETASTPKKDKKQDAKQPEPPKKEAIKINLFASSTAQSFTASQKNQAINGALNGLKKEFETQPESLIGADGAKRFLEYGLTVNGHCKWITVKGLLEGQLSKVEDLISKGGRKKETEMDEIFKPVLGARGGGKTKISSNVLFDDKVNSMGFEAPTPEQSRAPSKTSGAKK